MERDRWLYSIAASVLATSVAGLLVPLYVVRLGGGAAALGVSAALSSLVGAPGAVLAGRYADRTGDRRGVVVGGLAASAVALTVLPLLRSVPLVIAVNAVLALALSAVGPVVTMLVVEDSPESAWADRIGRLNQLQGYGGTAGFVLGTVWTVGAGQVLPPALAQRSLFGVAAVVGVASALLAARWLPRTGAVEAGPRRSDRVATLIARTNRAASDATFLFGRARFYWALRSLLARGPGALRTRLRVSRRLAVYFLAASLFFTGFGTFWAPLPLYLTDAGLASGAVFGLYLVNNVGSTVLYATAGTLSGTRDVRLVQTGALGLRAACFLSFAGLAVAGGRLLGVGGSPGLGPLVVVGALLALVGASWAFVAVTGTTIVSRIADPKTRGAVLGAYAAVSAVAGALGSLLGGLLAARGFGLAFAVSGALVIAGAVVVALARGLSRPAGPVTTALADD